jgi:hypothetical protein
MRRLVRAGPRVLVPLLTALTLGGCIGGGETKRTGSVGDELTADDLEVTVLRVDRKTPVPEKDITGLSLPGDGMKLVGVLVKVCSGYGAAIGQFNFELESTAGDGRPKYTANNYRRSFETVRDECGSGWIVYEIPSESRPSKVRFAFDDSGPVRTGGDNLEARFEWEVE